MHPMGKFERVMSRSITAGLRVYGIGIAAGGFEYLSNVRDGWLQPCSLTRSGRARTILLFPTGSLELSPGLYQWSPPSRHIHARCSRSPTEIDSANRIERTRLRNSVLQ